MSIRTVDVRNRRKFHALLLAKRRSIEQGKDDWEAWATEVVHGLDDKSENIFHMCRLRSISIDFDVLRPALFFAYVNIYFD